MLLSAEGLGRQFGALVKTLANPTRTCGRRPTTGRANPLRAWSPALLQTLCGLGAKNPSDYSTLGHCSPQRTRAHQCSERLAATGELDCSTHGLEHFQVVPFPIDRTLASDPASPAAVIDALVADLLEVGPPERGPGLGIRPSSRTAIKDELDMMMTSWLTPHAGGLAVNHRPQLSLTRRAWGAL